MCTSTSCRTTVRWLRQDPNDVNQVANYSRITAEVHPQLFASVRESIGHLNSSSTPVPFVIQVGDLVEGLCGSEELAVQQDTDAVEFVRNAKLGAPFLFIKGNHDITGPRSAGGVSVCAHAISGRAGRTT